MVSIWVIRPTTSNFIGATISCAAMTSRLDLASHTLAAAARRLTISGIHSRCSGFMTQARRHTISSASHRATGADGSSITRGKLASARCRSLFAAASKICRARADESVADPARTRFEDGVPRDVEGVLRDEPDELDALAHSMLSI